MWSPKPRKKFLIEKTNDDIELSPRLTATGHTPRPGRDFLIDRWNLLNEVRQIAPNGLEARLKVPVDSIWFEGHFPGEPILPGIALVNSVYEAIERDAEEKGESLAITSLKRIRFTGPVRPGETPILTLTREDAHGEALYHFKVVVNGNIVCSGLAAAANGRDKKA